MKSSTTFGYILQAMALAGMFTLALIYDGTLLTIFFGAAGSILGIQVYSRLKNPPKEPSQ